MAFSRVVVVALSLFAILCQAVAVPAVKDSAAHRIRLNDFVADSVKQNGPSSSPPSTAPRSSSSAMSTMTGGQSTMTGGQSGSSAVSSVTTPTATNATGGAGGATSATKVTATTKVGATTKSSGKNDSGCVDVTWLVRRGYKPSELVHSTPVVMDVLCPTGLSLPCGTEHHAVQYAGKTVSYAQLCGSSDVFCTASKMSVNSLWSFHAHAKAGIEVDSASETRLFMHDVRYSYSQQYALHSVMSAFRAIFA
jgi:hypothetical protein